jgi:hypothetical protein
MGLPGQVVISNPALIHVLTMENASKENVNVRSVLKVWIVQSRYVLTTAQDWEFAVDHLFINVLVMKDITE